MHFSAVNHLKPAWTSLMSCYWSNIHLMFSFYSIQVLMRKQNIQISQYTRLKVLFWSKHSESWFRAVYVKSELNCTCIQSIGKPSSLQLNSSPPDDSDINVVGWYRPPSASSEAATSLTDFLHNWTKSEFVLLCNQNGEFLSSTSDQGHLCLSLSGAANKLANPVKPKRSG